MYEKKSICLAIFILSSSFSFGQTENSRQHAGVTISLPWLNSYSYYNYNKNGIDSKTGLLGIGLSLFYQKNKNKFSLNGAFTNSIQFADVKGDGSEDINVQLIEAIIHHTFFKNFNGITGFNYCNYKYTASIFYPGLNYSIKKNDGVFGLTIGAELVCSKVFSLALFYRPALYSFETKGSKHIISLDARFNINCWKK
jgi:hypothetical protein